MKINTKSKKVNKAWLADHINDPYVKMAQREGYRSRAAYKLKEIDEELHLIRPGQVVVDLGATPGAWSQYLRRRFAPKEAGAGGAAVGALNGTIIALDILPFEPIEGVQFIQGDFREEAALVCKAFHGSGYSQLVEHFKANFRIVKKIKPKASRDRSAETFLVGLHPRKPGN
jgi:23S rRNA (uridine2552-2'-O)-methyltransferase